MMIPNMASLKHYLFKILLREIEDSLKWAWTCLFIIYNNIILYY